MPQNETVKIVRLTSGEELLAYATEYANAVSLRSPCIILMGENGKLSFTYWMPYSKDKKFSINKEHIVFTTVPVFELEEMYRKQTVKDSSGLILPESTNFNVRS